MTCPSLKTVSGKNSKLSEIGGQAFEGDEKLESINVPNVKSIGERAFYRTGLKTIKLGEKLEYLGEQAFSYSQLERITVPGSVKVIRKETFANCLYRIHYRKV